MLKFVADLGPLAAFFAAYAYSGDLKTAVVVLMVTMTMGSAALLLRRHPERKVHMWSTALVLGFGVLTLLLDDPLYIKLKPTALYLGLAAALLASLALGRNPVAALLAKALPQVPRAGWKGAALLWTGFMAVLAALNLYVAFSFSEANWVAFKTFALPLLSFVFICGHCGWLAYRHRGDGGRG
ncbi:MAG: septation protein IspZ [Betaproteobacteria bacterium AqS2]|uniref:Inner membrane-spanning protein YciB n=1 Tax=Candidatus Amphirhobacter heronislandensis TaxID=1732024 RepID=A0A930XWK5_9GAMM|nr:septation protein IspZ [Betaproteobacteria bacterium AqS2]